MQLYDYEQEHLDRVRKNAAECTVLLKSNGDFPLAGAGKIALYGSGARRTIKGGTGSGEVNSRFSVTIEQGLENAGFTVTSKNWMDTYARIREAAVAPWVADLKKEARAAHMPLALYGMGAVMPEPAYDISLDGAGDTAIYVLSRISGEGSDRNPVAGDVKLSETEIRDIRACAKKYDRFLLVLNVGGAVDLTAVQDEVANILVLSQLGVVTGDVLADIVLGRAYPSGRLTTTWSAWEDYSDQIDFGDPDDTRYKEGVYVGYRYFDTVGRKALYPFGFGLGYTTFEVKTTDVTVDGERVTATAGVTNTGKAAGKEVVQVYVSSPAGRIDKPYQALAAFVKTPELSAGENCEVTASFSLRELASYDTKRAAYVLEAGDYIVRVGTSSVDTKAEAVITLDAEAVVRKVRNALGKPDFEDWKPAKPVEITAPTDTRRLAAAAADIKTEEPVYDQPAETDPVVESLTNEELAYLTTGAFNEKGGLQSVIGEASSHVAGAAGETTSRLAEKDIPALVMADGPAGLRISKRYAIADDGSAEAYGENELMQNIGHLFPKPVRFVMKKMAENSMKKIDKSGRTIHEHYATAIPIGTAIAQTWNPDLAEDLGDLVGDEMERFGVHLWLAPALNIHRSIRCGRNFEYYSEDPLVAGIFAAAITKGVQKHPGCGTTIKHYAANNQEINRYASNSIVSERAMREIYLKGFDICVEESQPHALMTSYNLLNGIHTSCRKDLIEDILRAEFGYQGIVMTDWVIQGGTAGGSGKYAGPRAAAVAASGNDLMMPGSRKDYQGTLAGLKDGTVTREDLIRNASRVARMARKLASEHAEETLY